MKNKSVRRYSLKSVLLKDNVLKMQISYFLFITEPLQKLRVRLGTCKTGLSPPVTLCY